jgi:hypothetical protein
MTVKEFQDMMEFVAHLDVITTVVVIILLVIANVLEDRVFQPRRDERGWLHWRKQR